MLGMGVFRGASEHPRRSGRALAARDAETLPPLPQGLAADAQASGQLGLGHPVLVVEHELLKYSSRERSLWGGRLGGVLRSMASNSGVM